MDLIGVLDSAEQHDGIFEMTTSISRITLEGSAFEGEGAQDIGNAETAHPTVSPVDPAIDRLPQSARPSGGPYEVTVSGSLRQGPWADVVCHENIDDVVTPKETVSRALAREWFSEDES